MSRDLGADADDDGTATWSVAVAADASYLTGTSVTVTVSASKSGFTSPDEVTRTLAVDLVAPTAPTYTAPASLTGSVWRSTPSPPRAAVTSTPTPAPACPRVLPSTPSPASSAARRTRPAPTTATVTVTVTDAAGNTGTVGHRLPGGGEGHAEPERVRLQPRRGDGGRCGSDAERAPPPGAVGALSYATGDAGVCTVDAATGALTLVGVGECVITATAAGTDDYEEAAATFTVTVRAANAAATGEPSITGTARVGEVLTAAPGTLADVDGLPATFPDDYTFQWVRVDGADETDIEGATSGTYTLAAADAGKRVRVRVSFTDDDGNAEARTSAAYPGDATVRVAPAVVVTGAEGLRTTEAGGTDTFEVALAGAPTHDVTVTPSSSDAGEGDGVGSADVHPPPTGAMRRR